jgi:hypothetical protein
MSNLQLQLVICSVVAAQIGVVLWVVIRRRGIRPALIVNLLFSAGVLWSVAEYVPGEVAFARSDPDSDWFDYKNTIMAAFEAATVLASLLAFRGVMAAKIVAWVGFTGNFALSLAAAWLAFTFEFKCCGYL